MVLITGATGILGRVIALYLLKRGKKIRATKRPTSNLQDVRTSFRYYTDRPDYYFDKIEWADVDFDDLESLERVLTGVDEVYHCAALVSFDSSDDQALYKNNIDNTTRLLYALDPDIVRKFLFVSSIAVLDGKNDLGETDEDSHFNIRLPHSAYALSKHQSEMEVWRASAEGLNTVIINPGLIIGSGNWNKSSGRLMQEMSNRYTFPGSTAYVDVRDVAGIAISLMERSIFGERFIVVAENVKYRSIAEKVRKTLGKQPPVLVKNWMLNLVPALSATLAWIFPILKLGSRVNIASIKSDSNISNKKIRTRLAYDFITVNDSIAFHLKNYIDSHQE